MNITARAEKWIADSGDDTEELREAAEIMVGLMAENEKIRTHHFGQENFAAFNTMPHRVMFDAGMSRGRREAFEETEKIVVKIMSNGSLRADEICAAIRKAAADTDSEALL